jgi:hypothetical protein
MSGVDATGGSSPGGCQGGLICHQSSVCPTSLDQLLVCATLDHSPILHDHNTVRANNAGQPVRDDQRGTQTLPLSPGQPQPALTHNRFVPLGQRLDKVVCVCRLGCRLDLFHPGAWLPETQILRYGAMH